MAADTCAQLCQRAGHPRVLLATDITAAVSVRRAGGHFRVMRPNSIIGPPTDVHVLRSHYKKVCAPAVGIKRL